MPLLLSKQINPYSAYAVWHITETEEQLSSKIEETPAHTHPNKKSEWIVTRILIKYLCNLLDVTYRGVGHTESGKPILIDHQAQISISHSFPVAACLINTRKSCGIDIELPREKLITVKRKYIHKMENHPDDINVLCKVWAGKEVLFKIYGNKNLSLKDEMVINFESSNISNGSILKSGFEKTYRLHYEELFNYILAYSI